MSAPVTTIAFARRYQGVKEGPPPGSNIQRFGAWYGFNGVAWCAIYLSFVFYSTGVRFPGSTTAKGFSFCPAIVAWGRTRGRLSRTPHVGDIALKVDNGVAHHCELVTRILGNGFSSIGGNTGPVNLSNGGEVLEHDHFLADGWVFVTPPYSSVAPVPIPPKPRPAPVRNAGPITRNWVLTSPLEGPNGQIKWAQQRLAGEGYAISTADGIFGPQTEAAVRAFQRDEGLSVDGVLGPITGTHIAMRKAAA